MKSYRTHPIKKLFFSFVPTVYILISANMSVGSGYASDQIQHELQFSNQGQWTIAQSQPLDLLDLNQPSQQQSSDDIVVQDLDQFSGGTGSRLNGIWGLTEEVCQTTQKLADIVDTQSMAIQRNQIIFSDSKCLIAQSEGDLLTGHQMTINCLDADNQRFETELLIKPLGALKLEISSRDQSAVQYVYCAGLPFQ